MFVRAKCDSIHTLGVHLTSLIFVFQMMHRINQHFITSRLAMETEWVNKQVKGVIW